MAGDSRRARVEAPRAVFAVLAVAASLLGLAASAAAQAPQEHPGLGPYLQYCASCHGPDGRGGGPMAAELKRAPTDLTRLGLRYGTPLPEQKLLEFVDGRSMPRAHGSAEMPVWGKKLLADVSPGAGNEAYKRGTILVILDWIGTIQGPVADPTGE